MPVVFDLGGADGLVEVVVVERGVDDLVAVLAQVVGFRPPGTECQPWRKRIFIVVSTESQKSKARCQILGGWALPTTLARETGGGAHPTKTDSIRFTRRRGDAEEEGT